MKTGKSILQHMVDIENMWKSYQGDDLSSKEKEVYTTSTLYKGKHDTPGDILPRDQTPSRDTSEVIDTELDSKGRYVVKPKRLPSK